MAASSASASCERLDALPGRDLPGGLRVAEAHTRAARLKGLAKLDAMPASAALHIPKCWSVHTFTMRFPLDLIWLDKAGAVVRIDENVPPRRVNMRARALGRRVQRRRRARVPGRRARASTVSIRQARQERENRREWRAPAGRPLTLPTQPPLTFAGYPRAIAAAPPRRARRRAPGWPGRESGPTPRRRSRP